ncbi:MAG: nuclear transport factor 2 family protein [Myxococcota bacterium]
MSAREVVRRFYRAFGAGDAPAMAACLAPDVRWCVGAVGVPWSGEVRGRDAALRSIAAWRDGVDMLGGERLPDVAEGDVVVVRGRGRYRVRASGRVVDEQWVHVWTVQERCGQTTVASFDEYTHPRSPAPTRCLPVRRRG